jgi:hypothetical protein
MSKIIVNDHLWTPEEAAYQKSRGRHSQVKLNHRLFGPGGQHEGQDFSAPEPEEVKLQLDKDIYDYVVALDIEGLQDVLRKRGLNPKGSETDLRATLAENLQAERDADSTHS